MSEKNLESALSSLSEVLERVTRGLQLIWNKVNAPEYRSPSCDFYLPSGGQFQFTVGGPQYEAPRRAPGAPSTDPGVCVPSRMGAVYCEAAPPDPDNKDRLDWKKRKIVFAFSDKDIAEVLAALRSSSGGDVRLIHKLESGDNVIKTFSIKRGQDDPKWGPQWRMELSETAGPKNELRSKVSVYMKLPDVTRLTTFLQAAFPYIFGMNKV